MDKVARAMAACAYDFTDSYAINLTDSRWGIDNTEGRDAGEAINNALVTAYNQGIRRAYGPKGIYLLETPIIALPGFVLDGAGKKETIFKVKSNTDINAIENTQVLHQSVFRNFGIDGNKANNIFSSGGRALNLFMDNGMLWNISTFNVAKNGLALNWEGTVSEDTKYLNKVFFCDFEDSGEEGVLLGWRATDSWFCYNNVGSIGANLSIQGSTLRVIGNHFDGAPEYNILVENAGKWLKFSQNVCEAARKHSIYFRHPDWEEYTLHIGINDNTIRNCGSSGSGYDLVHIDGYSETAKANGIKISNNNIVIDSEQYQARHGVYLSNCDDVSVMGNEFSGLADTNPVGVLGSTVTNIDVIGNGGKNGITTY